MFPQHRSFSRYHANYCYHYYLSPPSSVHTHLHRCKAMALLILLRCQKPAKCQQAGLPRQAARPLGRPTEIGDVARWHGKVFHTDIHENDVLRPNLGWGRDTASEAIYTVMSLILGGNFPSFLLVYILKLTLRIQTKANFKVSLHMRC